MTEDEAKKKWCPHVRLANDSHKTTIAANRFKSGNNPESSACIASDCMMWTVDLCNKSNGKGGYLDERLPIVEWEGHCGLAK